MNSKDPNIAGISVIIATAMAATLVRAEITFTQVTGDEDSGIDSSDTYTHAIDFGNGAPPTVNGVPFVQDFGTAAGGIPNSGSRTYGPSSHNGNTPPAVTGSIADVFRDMRYNGPDGSHVELTGLTPGQMYELRLYDRAWDYEGAIRPVTLSFDIDSDSSVEFTAATYDTNRPAEAPVSLGGDVSWVTSYVYQAGPNGSLRVSFGIGGNGTYHFYGLTNVEAGPDETAPGIDSLSPAAASTGAYPAGNLVATFNELIQAGAGNITLVKDPLGTPSTTVIPVTDPRITIADNQLIIDPASNLDFNTGYEVTIDSGAILDQAETPNAYPGTAAGEWTFTTAAEDATAPVIVETSPQAAAINVVPSDNLVATFDENIVPGTGEIVIVDTTDGSSTRTIAVTDTSQVSIVDNVLVIDPAEDLKGATTYAVQIAGPLDPPAAVMNYSDVAFAGISDTTTWTFTTASTTTYTGPSSNGRSDSWSVPANWDVAVPAGSLDPVIPDGVTVTVDAVPPSYTGNLSIGAGSALRIEWLGADPQFYLAFGTPGQTVITTAAGSLINCRAGGAPTVPEIQMTGDFTYVMSQSTQPASDPTFAHGISGPHTFTLQGKGGCDAFLTSANDFGALVADPLFGSGFNIHANATGSLGGDVTILFDGSGDSCANLTINAEDAMADTATLTLNGGNTPLLTLNADDTIGKLVVNGVTRPLGTYGPPGSETDYQPAWLDGSGILTVAGTSPFAYWDLNGTTEGAGGATPSGTWDATGTHWNSAADGTGATTAWTAGQAPTFAAGSDATGTYTVTVDGTQDIVGLNVEEGTLTLSGGGLRLVGDSDLGVAGGLTASVDSTLSDDGTARALSKIGEGVLVLGGTNTYSGATGLAGGTLSVAGLADAGADSPLGNHPDAGPGGLLISSGTFRYTGGSASVDRGFTVSGDATIDLSAAGTELALGICESALSPGILAVTGGTGSRLSTGRISIVEGANLTLNPTTAAMTVESIRGFTSYPIPRSDITLGGTGTGNVVTGNIFNENPPGSGFLRPIRLTKTGPGEWTLSGSNSAESTTVAEGTLILDGGGNQNSPITVQDGAKLGFVLGSPVSSNRTLTLDAGHAIQVSGTPTEVSHTLMTTNGGITGTPALDPPIPGYALEVVGDELQLNGAVIDDYDTWAANYPDADLVDPDADFDGDGVSNDDERLFGLDPTDPTSINPIRVPFDAAAGSFSFTRRDDALTGHFSRVETSTDLMTWTEDVGAVLVAGDPDANGVETVDVVLSSDLLTAPRLFVRVAQDDGIVLSEDFEADNGGFEVIDHSGGTGSLWAWGTPDSDGGAGGGAVTGGAGDSANCWGTDITNPGTYANGTDTSLVSPVIDLSGVPNAVLSFAEAIDILSGDTLVVNVIEADISGGINVLQPAVHTSTPDPDIASADWGTVGGVAITGGQPVRLEWRFTGNNDGTYIGGYIDNVTVKMVRP